MRTLFFGIFLTLAVTCTSPAQNFGQEPEATSYLEDLRASVFDVDPEAVAEPSPGRVEAGLWVFISISLLAVIGLAWAWTRIDEPVAASVGPWSGDAEYAVKQALIVQIALSVTAILAMLRAFPNLLAGEPGTETWAAVAAVLGLMFHVRSARSPLVGISQVELRVRVGAWENLRVIFWAEVSAWTISRTTLAIETVRGEVVDASIGLLAESDRKELAGRLAQIHPLDLQVREKARKSLQEREHLQIVKMAAAGVLVMALLVGFFG